MRDFNADKLWINYQLRNLNQLNPRRYTLTHSDETGDLFLVIASDYAYDKLTPMRDEVLGEWTTKDGKNYFFYVYVRLDGEDGIKSTPRRNQIFIQELPTALKGIKYGDPFLFTAYPQFKSAPIYVHFQSADPNYNRIEYYQTFNQY